MDLFLFTTLTVIAFAANSVLNRFGVGDKLIDPLSFAMIRLLAGALILVGFLRRLLQSTA